jgi:hypothetical protein
MPFWPVDAIELAELLVAITTPGGSDGRRLRSQFLTRLCPPLPSQRRCTTGNAVTAPITAPTMTPRAEPSPTPEDKDFGANQQVNATGWSYKLNYAAHPNGNRGWVGGNVIVTSANRVTKPIPYDFFMLEDSQGRMYTLSGETAYWTHQVAGRRAPGDSIPPEVSSEVGFIFEVNHQSSGFWLRVPEGYRISLGF